MRGSISFWDGDRGIGIFRPDGIGADGDMAVTAALFLESGLGEPYVGDRFRCDIRVPRLGKVEPFDFVKISNSDTLVKDGVGASPATTAAQPVVAGNLSAAR
jgi:hypothetical protein